MAAATDKDGFAQIPHYILRRRDLGSTAKTVFAVIVDTMRGGGVAWPGFRSIAYEAGITLGTAVRAVNELEARGLLTVERGAGRRSNRYTLPPGNVSPPGTTAPSRSVPILDAGVPSPHTKLYLSSRLKKTRLKKKTKETTSSARGRKAGKPNPLFDTVVELFLPCLWDTRAGKPNSQAIAQAREGARIGRVTAIFAAKGATPDELRLRRDRYRKAWPALACTAEAVAKNWDEFATDRPAPTAAGGRTAPDHRAQKRAREYS